MVRDFPNTQWKWLIVDLDDGSLSGTDSDKAAAEFALSEFMIVIERNTCQVYQGLNAEIDGDGAYVPEVENIPEQTTYTF